MIQLSGEQALWAILGVTYGIYCAWAKYCEHRWPKPAESDDE